MKAIYDKRGIPMHVGDVVKVYHFTAATPRKKHHYMYKQVTRSWQFMDGTPALDLSHLDLSEDKYTLHAADREIMEGYEIVQSVKCDHEERPRKREKDK